MVKFGSEVMDNLGPREENRRWWVTEQICVSCGQRQLKYTLDDITAEFAARWRCEMFTMGV